jgi:hypothetical protein
LIFHIIQKFIYKCSLTELTGASRIIQCRPNLGVRLKAKAVESGRGGDICFREDDQLWFEKASESQGNDLVSRSPQIPGA